MGRSTVFTDFGNACSKFPHAHSMLVMDVYIRFFLTSSTCYRLFKSQRSQLDPSYVAPHDCHHPLFDISLNLISIAIVDVGRSQFTDIIPFWVTCFPWSIPSSHRLAYCSSTRLCWIMTACLFFEAGEIRSMLKRLRNVAGESRRLYLGVAFAARVGSQLSPLYSISTLTCDNNFL